MRIGVLGAGAWGTALAAMAAQKHEDVMLWSRDPKTVKSINDTRRNPRYLGKIALPEAIVATAQFEDVAGADILISVVPTQSLGTILPRIVEILSPSSRVVLCCKGIDRETGKLPHDLTRDFLSPQKIAALSGPSFAQDVAKALPTAVSLAAHDVSTAVALAENLSTRTFRIYATDDICGLETGGALKNVLALAVGVARGLELGASAEAALIARGFAEMERLALAMGGRRETLAGLSGLGDLVLTCSSPQSRNFAYGMALARKADLKNLALAEGVHTARMALELAQKNDIETPIVETVCALLEGQLTAQAAVSQLLNRPLREE